MSTVACQIDAIREWLLGQTDDDLRRLAVEAGLSRNAFRDLRRNGRWNPTANTLAKIDALRRNGSDQPRAA